jgi:gamma-D-glutamyl-L-lysine dipeptidyl-peptidase
MTDESLRVAVRSPVAQLFAEPRVASAQISQLLSGRVAEVLEVRDDWYRVRGPDDYEGWMHRGYVTSVPENGTRPRIATSRISLGCVTTNASGSRRAMPLGAYLTPDENVLSGEAIQAADQAVTFPPEAGAITRTAQQYFEGTSYFWGGVTPWGADCSGLVQSVYWLHGIQLHRDAWQQSTQGVAGEPNPIDALAGDLLFFSDRVDHHITHVAISLGRGGLVHLALGRGGYAIENLGDVDDPYVRKLLDRFVTARCILSTGKY